MRKVLLTAVLAGLIALPVLAQPGGGLFRGADGGMLLANPDVQKELKLSDTQKESLKKASTKMQEAMRKAREDMDREGFTKAMEGYRDSLAGVRKELTGAQTKRLLGIEVQMAERSGQARIFAREEVQKALKLTDKQKANIKELMSDMEKDAKELMEDAKGDRTKAMAAFKKLATMGKESFTKINKTLTEEQKKAWKELQGDKFEMQARPFGGGTGGRRPKAKDI